MDNPDFDKLNNLLKASDDMLDVLDKVDLRWGGMLFGNMSAGEAGRAYIKARKEFYARTKS